MYLEKAFGVYFIKNNFKNKKQIIFSKFCDSLSRMKK